MKFQNPATVPIIKVLQNRQHKRIELYFYAQKCIA